MTYPPYVGLDHEVALLINSQTDSAHDNMVLAGKNASSLMRLFGVDLDALDYSILISIARALFLPEHLRQETVQLVQEHHPDFDAALAMETGQLPLGVLGDQGAWEQSRETVAQRSEGLRLLACLRMISGMSLPPVDVTTPLLEAVTFRVFQERAEAFLVACEGNRSISGLDNLHFERIVFLAAAWDRRNEQPLEQSGTPHEPPC